MKTLSVWSIPPNLANQIDRIYGRDCGSCRADHDDHIDRRRNRRDEYYARFRYRKNF